MENACTRNLDALVQCACSGATGGMGFVLPAADLDRSRFERTGPGQPMMPRSRAMWTASVRELACNLLKIADT